MDELSHFIHKIIEHPSGVFNPETIIKYGGLTILFIILFSEIGIFFCFFFPGDSLIFTAGVLSATGDLNASLLTINVVMIVAVILGKTTAFFVGRKSGRYLMRRKESIFFKKEYVLSADLFYKKYGGMALLLSSFLPVIRTFVPIVAGILNISYTRFTMYNIFGAFIWIVPLSSAGYYLGRIHWVRENLGFIIIGMVLTITIPVIIRIVIEAKKPKNKELLKELD